MDSINKFNILKSKLDVGEIVKSKIIKKISSNKAVANIKGYDVIVKSDSSLKINSNTSFYISGFNEKEKIVLLKHLNINKSDNIRNKLINLNNYIKTFLKNNNLPLNNTAIEIAQYLYTSSNSIDIKKFNFILNHLKYFNDIPFLNKLFNININNQNLINLLTIFIAIFNKKDITFRKEKNNSSDNLDSIKEKFILTDKKDENIDKIKFLLNNKDLINDLLKINKNSNLPLFLYPLMTNSEKESNFMAFLNIDDEYYPSKLNLKYLEDSVSFKLNFIFKEDKINYHFIHSFKEYNTMIIIDTNNDNIRRDIKVKIKDLFKKCEKHINGNIEIIVKDKKFNKYSKNLDIYV